MANTEKKFKSGIAVSGNASVDGSPVTTNDNTQTLINKTIDGNNNTIQNIPTSALPTGIDAANIGDGSVSNAEFQSLSNVTSDVQAQIDTKAASADLASTAGGSGASLIGVEDSAGKFTATNLEGVVSELQDNIDAAQAGLKVKDPVQVVATSNISLSGEQTVDGVLTSSSRVLVAGQSIASENGVYVSASGAWVRATDFDGTPNGEVATGNIVFVESGTANANTHYVLNSTNAVDPQSINAGTDDIGFVVYSRAEAIVAGNGLDKSGLTLSVDMNDFSTTDLSEGSNLYHTDERAQDAVGNILADSSKIDFTYDDVTPEISASIVPGSLVDADVNAAAGIDASKLADGSVSNAELQFINSLSSNAQDQLNAKLDDSQLIDDDTMATATATNIPSAESVKAYVDTEVAAASGANTSLSNLTTPTAVNQHILPDTNGSRNLGGPALAFNELHINDIYTGTGGALVFETAARRLRDANGNPAIQFDALAQIDMLKEVDLNTNKIVNVVDPTADQDAATKKYVDDTVSGAAGANTTLSNLTSPTSINQHLIPDANVTRNLGSDSILFSTAYINQLADASDVISIRPTTRTLQSNNGTTMLSWSNDFFLETTRSVRPIADNSQVLGTGTANYNSVFTRKVESGDNGSQPLVLDGSEIDVSTNKIVNVVDPTADQDAATKKYVDDSIAAAPSGSAGDIDETSFSMSNNQAVAADVTGLAFSAATVRSAKVLASVEIDATTDSYEAFELIIIQKNGSFDMSISAVGDNSNVNFSITNAGQVQYTSADEAGFVSGDIKFRAITTTV